MSFLIDPRTNFATVTKFHLSSICAYCQTQDKRIIGKKKLTNETTGSEFNGNYTRAWRLRQFWKIKGSFREMAECNRRSLSRADIWRMNLLLTDDFFLFTISLWPTYRLKSLVINYLWSVNFLFVVFFFT